MGQKLVEERRERHPDVADVDIAVEGFVFRAKT
jgi:hypothetical protein